MESLSIDQIETIALSGFFSEYLPTCFNLSKKVLNNIPKSNIDCINPISFTMSRFNGKNDRRTIYIPEICSYLVTYNFMKEKNMINDLIYFADSDENSFSHILDSKKNILRHEQCYNNEFNNDKLSDNYIESITKKLKKAAGAKKILKLDISNFFSSFYTHMIPAILLGVDSAQKEFVKYNGNFKKSKNDAYKDYAELDKYIRKQNLNRTNGILTGTIFSRIIAEALLSRVDRELSNLGFRFVRYVDDYEIFLYEDNEKEVISKFSEVFKKYCLTINSVKTEILEFPYYIVKNFEKLIYSIKNNVTESDPLSKENLIELFNTFFDLEKTGTKGSIRYLLKKFEQEKPNIDDFDLYKAYLINIMVNDERSLVKSCSLLIDNKDKCELSEDDVKIITTILNSHISYGHDLEVIWIVYLLLQTGKRIKPDTIERIIKTDNELAQLILLKKGLLTEVQLDTIKNKSKTWLLNYELFALDIIDYAQLMKNTGSSCKNILEIYNKFKLKNIHFISFEE